MSSRGCTTRVSRPMGPRSWRSSTSRACRSIATARIARSTPRARVQLFLQVVNSRTTSKPSSSDGLAGAPRASGSPRHRCHKRKRRRSKSRRKPGGQPGHPGHDRALLPQRQLTLEMVDLARLIGDWLLLALILLTQPLDLRGRVSWRHSVVGSRSRGHRSRSALPFHTCKGTELRRHVQEA